MATIKSVSALIVDGDWIESKDQSPEGIRLIQTGNIGIGAYLDKPNRAKYISEETFERLNCTELNIGDILVSRLPDPIGRACRVPNNIGRAITAVDCTIIRLNPDKCDAEYFVQYTQSELYQNRLSQFFAGSTRTRISRKNLEQIEIPLPNIAEQRLISSTLGKVDELIALRKEQLAKLDQLVKSRFIELFGDTILNPFGWDKNMLGSVCDVRDGTHDSPQYYETGYPLVTSKNVTGGKIDLTDCSLICKADFDKINERSKVDIGDIIMPMIGTVGKPVVVDIEPNFAIKNVALIKFKNDSKVLNIYIRALLQSDYFDDAVLSKVRGGTQKFISLGDIRKLEVLVPPIVIQKRFATFVEQTDKSKSAIQQSLDKLELLKKSLMQEYFG